MRILINGLSARLGGGQTYLLNLLRHAPQDKDWQFFLLCPDNLDLTGLPENIVRVENQLKLENPFKRALWECSCLGGLAETLKADLLFCPGGLLPQGALPSGLKTAVTFQNMLPFDKVQRKRYPLGYRRLRDWLLERGLSSAMRRADLVIFISHFAQQFIQQRLGSLAGRSVVIPHGIDQRFFPKKGEALPRSSNVPEEPYFLYVSFIDHYKSQIEVVRAFVEVRKNMKPSAKLLLVGAENPQYGALLRHEIKEQKLEDIVEITGNLPHQELPSLYQHASINLFASCTENCPNILLEMMASGRPALVSDRGPMPEFGGEEVTYFDPDNVTQLVERWIKMQAELPSMEKTGNNLIKQASGYSWERAAKLTWSAIAQTIAG